MKFLRTFWSDLVELFSLARWYYLTGRGERQRKRRR